MVPISALTGLTTSRTSLDIVLANWVRVSQRSGIVFNDHHLTMDSVSASSEHCHNTTPDNDRSR